MNTMLERLIARTQGRRGAVHQSGGTLDNQDARVKEKAKVEKAKAKEVNEKEEHGSRRR